MNQLENIVAGGRILVVDDDNVLRTSIARILEEEGYSVANASDGAAAMDIVNDDPPDAILLDVMMPGMNGKQFLKQLRAQQGDAIPVVVMTALQGLASDRLVELGADDLVEKPFDVDELLNKVALALFRSGEYDTLSERPPLPSASGPEPAPETVPERTTVLMVDHDHDLIAQVDELLSQQGITTVALSRAGADLGRLATALEPSAILLELDGPGIDGLSALRELRSISTHLDTPVLMCASSEAARDAHAAELLQLHAECAVKPQQLDYLLSFIAAAVRRNS